MKACMLACMRALACVLRPTLRTSLDILPSVDEISISTLCRGGPDFLHMTLTPTSRMPADGADATSAALKVALAAMVEEVCCVLVGWDGRCRARGNGGR
eukprot:361682-Chlamydomonas_euryale.AAC.6